MYLTNLKQSGLIYAICLTCLVLYTSASFEACKKNSQCMKGYCCAGPKSFGFCMRNKQLGELCANTYLTQKAYTCGCELGLTCAIVSREKGFTRYRCVEIPKEANELKEKSNTTAAITKLLTAFELKHLLEIIKEKPQIKSSKHSTTNTDLSDKR